MPTPPLADVPPELAALPEYTDLRPLGQGGMGVVYVGTQAIMNRPVVLKVMTPAAEGGEAATLNAEDFNPAVSQPPKPPRKKKSKQTLPVGPLVGVVVAVATVVVGGVIAVASLGGKPAVADAGTPPAEAVTPAPPPTPASPALPAADGFEPLFNGRNTDDWAVAPGTADNWAVEGGVLVARGGSKPSHLFHNRYYSDFHLRAEFRINAAGNSGVYFRAAPADPYPAGYEAQINPTDANGPPTGSLYSGFRVVAASEPAGQPGEWTTLEVIAVGPSITVEVNGTTTSTHTAAAGDPARGRIAIQHLTPRRRWWSSARWR